MPKIQPQSKRDNPYYQAQAILSRRDHSEAEVREKLQRKGFAPVQIEEVLVWLKEQKLVNDAEFARRYVASITAYKAVGPRWLKQKLQAKKIRPQYIEAALQDLTATETQAPLVRQAAERWQRSHPRYQHDSLRLSRFLLSRGFAPQIVSDYVRELRDLS